MNFLYVRLKRKLYFTYYFTSLKTSHITSLIIYQNKQMKKKIQFLVCLFQYVISEDIGEVK